MTQCLLRLPVLFCAALTLFSLGGCGTINTKLANGMADYIPQWAGGVPADAPARPGTIKYDQQMKERERERLTPKTDDAAKTADDTKPSNAMGAIH